MKRTIILLLIAAFGRASGQNPDCTGGLGDPIVNITFGAGMGYGGALAAGITNMTYTSNQCPNDGYYTIVHSSSGCFGGSWLNVLSDHTGNPNGYFMLINASYQPSDFYVQTITGLCPGTTYQFAAWILNMVSEPGEILPNITFNIEKTDGTVLGTYNTGDIPEASNWVQYGLYFNTPPGIETVVLRMTNNASGGNGNDLGLDDITFRAAGPTVQTFITGFASDTILLCQPDTQTLRMNATVENCYPTAAYQWQQSLDSGVTWTDIPGDTLANFARKPSAPGYYEYRLTVAQAGNIGLTYCKVASAAVVVNVVATPLPAVTITASPDSSCAGMSVVFTATPDSGGAGPVYQWLFNGVNTGSGGPAYTSASLSSNDVITCIMTSNAVCVLDPVVVSNPLSVVVTAIPATGVVVGASANNICQDSNVIFTATPSNGGVAPTYQWEVNGVAASGSSAIFSDAILNNGDVISCTMQSSLTCASPVAAPPVTMIVYPLPVIQLTPDTVIEGGRSLQLNPQVSGSISAYQWSPGKWLDDPGVADPISTPVGTITYRLTVVTTDGCVSTAEEKVGVYYRLAMPAAFTPNGDGRNDVFRLPPSVPVEIRLLAVYNRLGARLYSGSGAGAGWDGTFGGQLQPSGTYVWVLVYKNPLTREVESAKGVVELVR